jgi:hypothetical protein
MAMGLRWKGTETAMEQGAKSDVLKLEEGGSHECLHLEEAGISFCFPASRRVEPNPGRGVSFTH